MWAGNDVGGMYGDNYDLLLGGGTLGFAYNSGRIMALTSAGDLPRLEENYGRICIRCSETCLRDLSG